ncbi:MAG TPA: NADH-quinone oxidoreductase subunit L [Chloroflexi bacterium]|nr:NADH-quinone oxidoreductase subunit L [Chloroflexota bacterium]
MDGLFSIVPLIILAPFTGVLINVFFGRKLMPRRDSVAPGVIASSMAGFSFLIAVLMFFALLANPAGAEVPVLTWINVGDGDFTLHIPWTLKVDTLSSVMMLVVTGVGTLIHIYAIGYMHGDIDEKAASRGLEGEEALDFKRRRYARFFAFFNLFLGSMLVLVTANNYLMMFVGWELVGLCSYLLIGFWFDSPEKNEAGQIIGVLNSSAGRKAFVVNRVGDFGMLLAIMLIFWSFGTLEFDDVFARAECMIEAPQAECLTLSAAELAPQGEGEAAAEEHGEGEARALTTPIALGPFAPTLGVVVTAITLLLLLGATGKSAQIPLFVWLPDAMAGPTPVSALIHAATMVTAGIYMITRSNVLYAMAPVSGMVVAVIGGATAFVAASIAVAQFDIKRVLAYSTISQLGFMIAAVGLGGYIAGIFHLATHAFFKALLFLGSGSVIHGMEHGHHHAHGQGEHHDAPHGEDERPFDPQDMRQMGGLRKHMPVTTWVYIIGALALAGIPPLAGFWSKDEILLDASLNSTLVYILLTVAAFFTAFYMGRQVFMVFYGSERTEAARHAQESPPVMTIPLIVLAGLSVVGGLINLPVGGLHPLGRWLEESVANAHIASFNILVATISTVLALVAIGLSYLLYGRKPLEEGEADPLYSTGPVFTFLNRKWYWDELYAAIFVRPYNRLGDFLANAVDWQFWHDFVHDRIIADAFQGWAAILSRPIDLGIVDGAVNGVAQLVESTSRSLRRVQTGYVRNYALAVLMGVVAILAYLAIRFLV